MLYVIFFIIVHSHVNHSADWHGGCTFCPECISPIAVGDSKWRNTLLFTAMLGTVTFFLTFYFVTLHFSAICRVLLLF